MSDVKIYPVNPEVASRAYIGTEDYQTLYRQSIADPETFWAGQAQKFLDWSRRWNSVMDCDFNTGHFRWFEGGKLNVSANCLDRHLKTRGDQVAIIWEGDDPSQDKKITYNELYDQVCRFANVLKTQGVQKGDRVCIYMPMIVEAAAVMLACTRIGAVHSIVFGGFSAESLKDRILDADCKYLVCADES
ncbi:MAG: AMP-binding protein, partial [Gammaproteobacteria bacterium]